MKKKVLLSLVFCVLIVSVSGVVVYSSLDSDSFSDSSFNNTKWHWVNSQVIFTGSDCTIQETGGELQIDCNEESENSASSSIEHSNYFSNNHIEYINFSKYYVHNSINPDLGLIFRINQSDGDIIELQHYGSNGEITRYNESYKILYNDSVSAYQMWNISGSNNNLLSSVSDPGSDWKLQVVVSGGVGSYETVAEADFRYWNITSSEDIYLEFGDISPSNNSDVYSNINDSINISSEIRSNADKVDPQILYYPPNRDPSVRGMNPNPLYHNDTAWFTDTEPSHGSYTYRISPIVIHNDQNLGVINETDNRTFRYTSYSDPLFNIFNPQNNEEFTDQDINYTATVSSRVDGTVYFYRDGSVFKEFDHSKDFSVYYVEDYTQRGVHDWHVEFIRDLDGSVYSSVSQNFTVFTDPSVFIDMVHPSEGQVIDRDSNFLQADIDSNIPADIFFYLDGEKIYTDHHDGSGEYTAITQIDPAQGSHSWKVVVDNQSDRYTKNRYESDVYNFTYRDEVTEDPRVNIYNNFPEGGDNLTYRPYDFESVLYSEVIGTYSLYINGSKVSEKYVNTVDQNTSVVFKDVNLALYLDVNFSSSENPNYPVYYEFNSSLKDVRSDTFYISISDNPADIFINVPEDSGSYDIGSGNLNSDISGWVVNVSWCNTINGSTDYSSYFKGFLNGEQVFYKGVCSTGEYSIVRELPRDVLRNGDNTLQVKYYLDGSEEVVESSDFSVNMTRTPQESISFYVSLEFLPIEFRIITGIIFIGAVGSLIGFFAGSISATVGMVITLLGLTAINWFPSWVLIIAGILSAGIVSIKVTGDR